MDDKKVFDILDKFDFFQGQRAGRELWFDKPKEVQDKDIADFVSGINHIRDYLKNTVVLTREEINNADYFYVKDGALIPVEKGRGKFITIEWYTELLMKMPLKHELEKAGKESAEKFANFIKSKLFDLGNVVNERDIDDMLKEFFNYV